MTLWWPHLLWSCLLVQQYLNSRQVEPEEAGQESSSTFKFNPGGERKEDDNQATILEGERRPPHEGHCVITAQLIQCQTVPWYVRKWIVCIVGRFFVLLKGYLTTAASSKRWWSLPLFCLRLFLTFLTCTIFLTHGISFSPYNWVNIHNISVIVICCSHDTWRLLVGSFHFSSSVAAQVSTTVSDLYIQNA